MFERWLKKTKPADHLDLARHQPAEFAGKIITVQGREYVLGACVRTSNQGYSHRLVNRKSGLCLHIIQIRVEYNARPGGRSSRE